MSKYWAPIAFLSAAVVAMVFFFWPCSMCLNQADVECKRFLSTKETLAQVISASNLGNLRVQATEDGLLILGFHDGWGNPIRAVSRAGASPFFFSTGKEPQDKSEYISISDASDNSSAYCRNNKTKEQTKEQTKGTD